MIWNKMLVVYKSIKFMYVYVGHLLIVYAGYFFYISWLFH